MKAENADVTDEQLKAAWDSQRDETLHEQITRMMIEYGDAMSQTFRDDMEKRIKEIVAETNAALVKEIRAGVGLDSDPTVKLSEVKAIVNKLLLDGAKAKGDGHNPEDLEEGRDGDKPDAGKVDMGKAHDELVKERGFPVV